MLAQPVILGQVRGIMIASQQAIGEVQPVVVLNYPLLPYSPYSPKWKGSPMIRGVLTKMVARAGHGRNGRNQALGVGAAPFGWPMDVIQWTDYKGACRSKLSVEDVTRIIVALLRYVGIDENLHILKEVHGEREQEQEDDVQGVEQGNVGGEEEGDGLGQQQQQDQRGEEHAVEDQVNENREVGDLVLDQPDLGEGGDAENNNDVLNILEGELIYSRQI